MSKVEVLRLLVEVMKTARETMTDQETFPDAVDRVLNDRLEFESYAQADLG